MTTTATAPKADKFGIINEFTGERQDIDREAWAELEAEIDEAEHDEAKAKARVLAAEQAIKRAMAGKENLYCDGEMVWHWRFVSTSNFQTRLFRLQHKDLYNKFLKSGSTRRFKRAVKTK